MGDVRQIGNPPRQIGNSPKANRDPHYLESDDSESFCGDSSMWSRLWTTCGLHLVGCTLWAAPCGLLLVGCSLWAAPFGMLLVGCSWRILMLCIVADTPNVDNVDKCHPRGV